MSEQVVTDLCWIRIRIFGLDADGLYRIEAELDDGSWHKQMMKLGDEEMEELLLRRDLGTKSYGQYLYELLFMKPVSSDNNLTEQTLHDVFQKAWGRSQSSQQKKLRVQLWIAEEGNELHRIRWERLYVKLDNEWRSLANFEQTPFSRFTRLPIPEPQLNSDDRPLKVLMAVSNPKDNVNSDQLKLAAINVEQEISNFYEAVKDISDIEITVIPGRTGISDKLKAKLIAPRSTGARFSLVSGNTTYSQIQKHFKHHVLHFLGHGVFERIPPQQNEKQANAQPQLSQRVTLLVLEDEKGGPNKVPDETIVDYLVHLETSPRMVFLSACDTVKFDERNPSPFTGLGPKLVAAGFPAVVAMQDQVPIKVARELVEKFYSNLLSEGVIDLALNRSRLFSFDPEGLLDSWTIPTLFMRTQSGRLFSVNPVREALSAMCQDPRFKDWSAKGPKSLRAVMFEGTQQQIDETAIKKKVNNNESFDLATKIELLVDQHTKDQSAAISLCIAILGDESEIRPFELKGLIKKTASNSLESGSSYQILPVYVDLSASLNSELSLLTLLSNSLEAFWPSRMNEKVVDSLLQKESITLRIIFDNAEKLTDSQRISLFDELRNLANKFPRHQSLLLIKNNHLEQWTDSCLTHFLYVIQEGIYNKPVSFALDAIFQSPQFRPYWKYGFLPLEAVMLSYDQIHPNWENMRLPLQGRVDLLSQLMFLLEEYEGKAPLFIALTGLYGMSNSDTLRSLVRMTAQRSMEDTSQPILPIYIDLPKYVSPSYSVPPYLTLLTLSLNEFWPGTLTEKEMDKLLRDGTQRFRFFFDHGDDLSETQRRTLTKEIYQLVVEFPIHPCFVAKTRGMWDWATSGETHVLDVQPLDRRRIIRFLFDSAQLEERLRKEKGETTESKEEQNLRVLYSMLGETQLFDLAGMPWMFIQIVKQALTGYFDFSRVGILTSIIEERRSFITLRHGIQSKSIDTLSLLAYRMHRQNLSIIHVEQAFSIFESVRGKREYLLEDMLDALIGEDLLVYRGDDYVGFVAPMYQSYFCAQYLNKNDSRLWHNVVKELGSLSQIRWWDDTLTLLAGLTVDPVQLLEMITYTGSLKEGDMVFLASRCLLEAQMNQYSSKYGSYGYVETLIIQALAWRSDGANEPWAYQRLRAVESLGQIRRVETVRRLTRIITERTRVNSHGKLDFEHGFIRQAAGRALRRLLPPRERADPKEYFTAELRKLCEPLEEVIQKWISAGLKEIIWLENRMQQPNNATKSERKTILNDALASLAAFALGDMRNEAAHVKLIAAFLNDRTVEVVRWAITDALTMIDPKFVMNEAILPIIESGKLDDPVKFSERREQLIYLIGQLRHPNETARAFVENVLTSPGASILPKGRAILAISSLMPPNWKDWKIQFESIALNEDNIIVKKIVDNAQGIYLRTKALQALAEIGDLETVQRISSRVEYSKQWPPELERVFFTTSEQIVKRSYLA